MFDAYAYFASVAPQTGIAKIVRTTGLSRMEELKRDISETEFPCLAVEVGGDGVLNIATGCADRSYHTFYVFDTTGCAAADPDLIESIIGRMFDIGKRLLYRMKTESATPDMPCYGFEADNVSYSRIGPVGMQCYGYVFNIVMNRDHESYRNPRY